MLGAACRFWACRFRKELLDGQESLRYELRQVKMQVPSCAPNFTQLICFQLDARYFGTLA